jgi:hypothetical protein
MDDTVRKRRARFLSKSTVITALLLCAITLAMIVPIPVFAADDSLKNMLPTPGFAPDWVMKEPATLYNSENLFDHINGEGELYIPYGFDRLATVTYLNPKHPDVWVVADVYRMGSLLDAFGIYSNYRKPDAADAAIGADGFVSASQLMFYQDRYFVRIQVTGAMSLEQNIFIACGRALSRNLPPNSGRPGELEVLKGVPGLVMKSERYLAQSLLGYAFFRRGMIADVMLGGKQVQAFVVFENSPGAARKAFDDYGAYLKAEGQEVKVAATSDRISLTALDPLYGGVFLEQAGSYLIGAIRMEKASTATAIVGQLRERLLKR